MGVDLEYYYVEHTKCCPGRGKFVAGAERERTERGGDVAELTRLALSDGANGRLQSH